jgi:hypothetical protein
LVLVRVLQEVDDLDELVLGLVNAGHVDEGDLWHTLSGRVPLRLAPPDAEDATLVPLRPAEHPHQQPEEQQARTEAQQERQQPASPLVRRPGVDDHALLLQQLLQARVWE